MIGETVSTLSQKVTSVITYSASGAAIFFGLTANELGVFLGLFIAFGAGITRALLDFYFKSKHFRLVEDYIKSETYGKRKDDENIDICHHCPLIKHKHDYDNT